ncbi:DAZ-associated protein 1 isoform X5 [Alosa pseudoharengus]|uniref:DAZ-associated protein 1 isoform X6 n=1 Tax=Alosa sapidissima TaxID=34773 RepID=UPI001C09740C|nr:DAZ-associated protein 1 isoform X6 [Alosa sapidissima]XP_048107962.1 DAZ-associated protein 1 isoform X6 [Alosa alosa]
MVTLQSAAPASEMNNNLVGDEVGKLFVGGLDWSTTQETLRNYFSQYGEVVDCVIMKDKSTNQSRGFGFVKFKDPNCVRTVLETKPHNLDGRNIDPKPCTPRGMQPEKTRTKEGWKTGKSDSNKSKKIFVGGIPHNCGEPELRDYFNRFGVVTEVVMIYDAEKQRPRGFGFITFEAEQSVDQAVNMHFHDIMGKKVEVKKAEPRDSKAPGPGQIGANQWGPRGILSAANGWSAPPAQGWQQSYGPQGVWVSTGQPIGGYGPPLPAGRGAPAQPPSPFNAFLVTAAPAGSFAAPQGYPQQGYSTPPQFGYSFGTPQGDQFVPQGMPPPPTTPGTAPLGFAPATTPTQDMSKAATGQPDFPYSQYGYGQDLTGFGHSFADPTQQTASYAAPTAQPSAGPQTAASSFARGQNHNVQGFHPYRR